MSNSMELKGKIIGIAPTQQVTDSFKKREFALLCPSDRDPKYDDEYLIQFTQDKCSVLDSFSKDDNVVVCINLRGRKFPKKDAKGNVVKGKFNYFTNLEAWRISKDEVVSPPPVPENDMPDLNDDDLPF